MNLYYNSSWSFFSANFNATASPTIEGHLDTIFLNTVTFNPFTITFVQPIPFAKSNTISVTQVRGLSTLKPSNSQVQYNFSLQINGGKLPYALINDTVSAGSFQIFNASTGLLYGQGFISGKSYAQSSISVNFTADLQGEYYYVLSSTPIYEGSQYTLQYTGKFNVSSSLKFTNGLHPTLTGVSPITQNTNNTFKLTIAYNNGTLINGTDSAKTLKNLTVQLQRSTTTVQALTVYKISNGTFAIYLNVSKPGNYFLVASISQTIIGTKTASGQTDLAVNVTNTPVKLNRGMILSLSEPSGTLLANVPYTYTASFEYFNGSSMNASDTKLTISNMNITVYSYSTVIEYGTGKYLHHGMAGFNLSLNAGSYFILVKIGNETINGQIVSASHSLNVLIVKEAGTGMAFHVVSPNSAEATTPFVVSITVSMDNGINLTYLNTVGIAKLLIVDVYYNSTIQIISPLYTVSTLSPGQIALTFNETKTGTYTIAVSFNGTIDNIQASGKGSTQTLVTDYNPQQSAWQNIWSSFYKSPFGQFITSFGEEILIAVIMAIAGSIIVRMRRSGEARELQESRAQDSVLDSAIEKVVNATTVGFTEQGIYTIYTGMNYSERDAFMTIHDKYLKHVFLKLDGKRTSLKKARDMLKKEIEAKQGPIYEELKEMEGVHL